MSLPRNNDNPFRKGPPEVTPWLLVTRDSPVVLERKFGYIVDRHKALAKAEANLVDGLKAKVFKSIIRDLRLKVENAKAWLNFSVATLSNHVRHALARCEPDAPDGKLLRENGAQRKRYGADKPLRFRKPRKAAQRKIRYFATILEEYKLAKAACAGHSGSNDALKKLIDHAASVIAKFSNAQFKEREDAEQLAIMSLLTSAKKFTASHKGMARYNTYAWWRARKSVECRATRDCKPGIAIKPKTKDEEAELISVGSINAPPPGKDDAKDSYHPQMNATDEGRRLDVQRALAELSEIERAVVVGVLMQNKSLRQVGRETGFSPRRLRDALDRGQTKLRRLLSDFD